MRYIYTAMMHSPFRALLLIVGMMFALDAFAWHDYQPMVVEGRRWDISTDLSYVIEGDTIHEGMAFKKVYAYEYQDDSHEQLLRKKYYCSVREENKKVYVSFPRDDGTPLIMLLCDFSWGVMNKGCDELHFKVHSAVNTIIQGKERRVINMIPRFDQFLRPLVEGLGYLQAPFEPYAPTNVVFWCYDGSQLLYNIETDDNVLYNEDVIAVTDGEVNGDGAVDSGDVNATVNMMLGKPLGERCDDVAADMNLNGKIDIADVNAIINVMLGKQ